MSVIPASQETPNTPLLQEYTEGYSSAAPVCSVCQQVIQQNGNVDLTAVEGLEGRQICQQSTAEETTETVDTKTPIQKQFISPRTKEFLKECGGCLLKGGGILTLIACSPLLCACFIITIPCQDGD
ncbi:MAG: hypothetical protein KGJ02_03700 [Verrucomicrobiota bacterium]|nr:hypothetical protein [Verrucomicrobiota bacterium]